MKILITGGTGFIGKSLCQYLSQQRHDLTVLSRKPDNVPKCCGKSVKGIAKLDELNSDNYFDAIINLAGEGIADKRWTSARKQILLASRIKTTQNLITFIESSNHKPEVLISGSTIGYYGNQGGLELDETANAEDGFTHQLCEQWEDAAKQAETFGVRVCIIRTGLVIGSNGGFVKRMLPTFKLGLGGVIGNGQQWMSWIHLQDYIRIVDYLLNSTQLQSVFNGTAPHPVTNAEFTKFLANRLNRPALFPVPGPVLKFVLGEMAELILGGQRVIPGRLQSHNFKFEVPTLDQVSKQMI